MMSKATAERLKAVLTLLIEDGHLTVQGARQIMKVIEVEGVEE